MVIADGMTWLTSTDDKQRGLDCWEGFAAYHGICSGL